MLHAVASLALALAPTPAKVLAQGVRCDAEFTSCTSGVSALEAKLEHIKTLKASHGVLANDQVGISAACTPAAPLPACAARSPVPIPSHTYNTPRGATQPPRARRLLARAARRSPRAWPTTPRWTCTRSASRP